MENFCSRPENLQVTEKTDNVLQVADYAVFASTLLLSAIIGIYFGFINRNKSAKEFMMGDGKTSPYPIAMSLATTFFSAITILSTPVEFARYGTMFAYMVFGWLILITLSVEIFAPMFQRMQLTSIYEYLEIRFSRSVKYLATIEYLIQNIIHMGMVIYLPAVAVETATNIDRWVGVWLTGAVCIFYTSLGGLKAVVWTDTFQIFIMLSGFLVVIIQGSYDHGGLANIYETYSENGRVNFSEFSLDPRYRHTFWTIMIGTVIGGQANYYCTSQSFSQRMLACKDKKNMRIASYLGWCLIVFIIILAALTGMTLFKYNQCCDPLKAGWVESSDQLIPYLTVNIFKNTPGAAGLYVSAAFAGTLSTVSSAINSMSTCFVTDLIQPNEYIFFGHKNTDKFYSNLTKFSSVIFGLLCIAFTYLAANLGGILQASLSLIGVICGPMFAVFALGFFNPWAESTGVFVGYTIGNIFGILMYLGSTTYPPESEFKKLLPTEISGCVGVFNCSSPSDYGTSWCPQPEIDQSRPAYAEIYSISYLYFGTVGLVSTFVIGSLISGVLHRLGKASLEKLPIGTVIPIIDKKIVRCSDTKELKVRPDSKEMLSYEKC